MLDIPPIQKSYDKSIEKLTMTERYYTPRYQVDFEQKGNDFCVLFHSNRICVLTLALTHSILTEHKQVDKIDFQVSSKVDRLNNTVSGKGKRGAQILTPNSVIFYVNCTDGSKFPIYSCVPGKLVEVNEQLMKNPNLMVERPLDQGYLAIVLPTIPASARYKEELLTPQKYQDVIRERHGNSDYVIQ